MRAALLLLCGCGNVVFVDPNAALEAKLVFGVVERLIVDRDPRAYFHVRIQSREAIDRVVLSVSGPEGELALPTERAQVQDCGKGQSCLSITLGAGVPEDVDQIVLAVSDIGHSATAPIVVRRLERHGVHAEAKEQNSLAEITIVDPIRRFYADAEEVIDVDEDGNETVREEVLLFPRDFEVRTTAGACSGESDPTDGAWSTVTGSPFSRAILLSEGGDPLACAELRPALPPRGPMVAFTTVTPRAELATFRHTYTPPVENAPMVFLPFFDLELPSAVRCTEAQNLIRSAIADAATRIAQREEEGAEILALPSVQIAEQDGIPCRQSNERFFSASSVAKDVMAALVDAFGPERRVRLMMIYAANLEIELTPRLDSDFQQLNDLLRSQDGQYQTYLLAIAPESAVLTLEASRQIPWLATEEPTFRETITSVLSDIWPFRSSIHDPRTVVPLLPSEEIDRFTYYRICSSSQAHVVRGIGDPASSINDAVLTVPPQGPGYYSGTLSSQQLIERQLFILENLVVEWQGCERLCDRPAPGGDPNQPWIDAPDC